MDNDLYNKRNMQLYEIINEQHKFKNNNKKILIIKKNERFLFQINDNNKIISERFIEKDKLINILNKIKETNINIEININFDINELYQNKLENEKKNPCYS